MEFCGIRKCLCKAFEEKNNYIWSVKPIERHTNLSKWIKLKTTMAMVSRLYFVINSKCISEKGNFCVFCNLTITTWLFYNAHYTVYTSINAYRYSYIHMSLPSYTHTHTFICMRYACVRVYTVTVEWEAYSIFHLWANA